MSGRIRLLPTALVVAALLLSAVMKLSALPRPCDLRCGWVIAAAGLELFLAFGLIVEATRVRAAWTLVGALIAGIVVGLQRVLVGGGARGCKCLGNISLSNEWALVALGSGLVLAALVATDSRVLRT